MHIKHHPVFWMAASTILMGTLGVSLKFVLDHFEPVFVTGLRTLISAATVAVVTWNFQHAAFKRGVAGHVMLNALLHGAASTLFIVGLNQTQALNYAMLGLLSPVFIYLGSIIFLREPFVGRGFFGACISLLGGVALVGAPLLEGESLQATRGDLLIILGLICLAALLLHTKRLYKDLAPHQVISYRMLISGVLVIVLSMFIGESLDVSRVSWQAWLALAYASVVAGGIALLVLYSALQYIKAEDSASLFYLDPLAGVLTSALILGERFDSSALAAGSVIVLGVVIAHPAHIHRFHFYHVHYHKEHILRRLLNKGLHIAHLK